MFTWFPALVTLASGAIIVGMVCFYEWQDHNLPEPKERKSGRDWAYSATIVALGLCFVITGFRAL